MQQGVQALLDNSEDIFKSTITVLDSSLKLLAYTRHCLPDDDANAFLIENGYHSAGTLEKFRRFKRFHEPELTHDVVVSTDRVIFDFVTMKYFFKHFSEVSVYVVMLCNHREVSQGLADLFKILNAYIEIYVDRGYPYEGKYSAFDTLMYDLLAHQLTDRAEIRQRGDVAGIPFRGLFDVYKISLSETAAQSLPYLTISFSRAIPDSRVSFYGDCIVVLNIYTAPAQVKEKLRSTKEILERSAAKSVKAVGISHVFNELSGFSIGYQQAEEALRTGGESLSDQEGIGYYKFEDWYVKHMIASVGNSALYSNSEAEHLYDRLDEYCKEHNCDYIMLLYTYLMCERRISNVAEAVHLHRNTVIYHLSKIEELLDTTFDEPTLRVKLLLEIYKRRFIEQT